MKRTLVITPDNWFDLARLAMLSSEAGDVLEFALADADGRRPLATVRLDELRAIHQTFGAWWSRLGGSSRPSSIKAGTYDRLLAESRALLKEQAAAALEGTSFQDAQHSSTLAAFPDLGHGLLADPLGALGFLKPFLALSHSPSLTEWARQRAAQDTARADCRSRPWLRLVLQKAASEDDLPEALACLRAVYADDDAALRRTLLSEEAHLLQGCDLTGPEQWTRSLGIDRDTRQVPWITSARSRVTRSSDHPDTTVLVPSYCHEAFIEAALESILAQTHSRLRAFVLDDCSSDRTVEFASRVQDSRLRLEVNPRNLGLGNTVLRALETIDTPYVALLNSDDAFHPDRLTQCVAVLDSSPRVQVVATGVVPIDTAGRRLSLETVSRLFDGRQVADWIRWFSEAGRFDRDVDLLLQLLERNFLVSSSNIVCRSDFLRNIRDALGDLEFCFDWQVFLEAAAGRTLSYLPEELLGYRLHASNTVWFDDARRARYVVEVNRVLARTLRRVVDCLPRGAPSLELFHLALSHATKHSEANGFLLHAAEVLSQGVQSRDKTSTLQQYWESFRSGGTRADGNGREAAVSAERYAKAMAARALAEACEEEARAAREAEQGTRRSPEWLVGDTLWNKARLSRLGLPAARAVRQLQDRRTRWRLAVAGRSRRNGSDRPRAIVASCWQFPTYTHTFVYQEIQALEWAGLDYRLFCCDTAAKTELPTGFEDLWRKRVVLRSEPQFAESDRAHFLKTRPDRVHALLRKLQAATGSTTDALLREPIVMMGFTFARHVELSRAEYLHTYFFYDQSFMALMAAYLLDIPRGVTAYADHMLHDYPFKCVPLHLELADIVVATSRRIKRELSAIGGTFEAKIIVKPNGIDTSQFPYVAAAERLGGRGEPELISVSRIEPKKGLNYLIQALRILKDRGVPARLTIVGGVDPHTSTSLACFRELMTMIDRLELSDRVLLQGAKKRPDILPLLMGARLFVAPYVEVASGDKDGIPTAVLEAMSTGLPIVATDSGSILEAVTDGAEGICVPQRDPERLADAIQRMLADAAVYTRMSEAARHRAVSEFDVHVTEKPLHERIQACLRAKRS